MAYTDPVTWASGAVLTAAELNEQLRDNMVAVKALADLAVFQGVEAGRITNQAVATATAEFIVFPVEGFDYGGWFVANSQSVIVPAGAIPAGYTYIMCDLRCRARWASNAVGYRRVRFTVNGVTSATVSVDANSGAETEVVISDFVRVVAGDVIKVEIYQNSGGNLNMETCTFHVARVGVVV